MNFEVSDEMIHHLSEEYIKYLPEFNHFFDGAIELLDYLKPKYQLQLSLPMVLHRFKPKMKKFEN